MPGMEPGSVERDLEVVSETGGVEIPAKYGPPRASDVWDSQADTTFARAELGHDPKLSFEEGLRRTLEWHKRTT
jgi:nucleoside-diphosphate-sugar epimerase